MLMPNAELGAYRLIEQIGSGGMGEVWKAEDTRLGRIVAIKILPPSIAADAEALARLRREARTAAQLNHQNIATIHSIEEAEGRLFIVMEFVDGEPLARLIKRGMSEAEICRIGRAVADALAEAHAKGIIHRDIKPDNIIVSGSRVKVLDFGIAKQIGASGGGDENTATAITQQGMIVGTIHYMSPEQALGKPLDPRSDVFSLGVVLYEAATGRLPFRGETVTDTMTQIIRDEPQEPARINPKVSPGLNAIIQRCMRKNREERYPTAANLGHALEEQLGRASTARYTAAPATVLTASRLQTVQETKKSSAWIWIVAGIVVLGVLAAVVARQHRTAAGASAGHMPAKPAAAPSTASVNVTAAPQAAPAPPSTPVPATSSAPENVTLQEAAAPAATQSSEAGASPAAERPRAAAPTQTAEQHFRNGEDALLNRNFAKAVEQYQLALDDKSNLEERERALSRLGIAIAIHNRPQAERVAREISFRWPGDPDLERIRAEFPGAAQAPQRPFGRRRPRE